MMAANLSQVKTTLSIWAAMSMPIRSSRRDSARRISRSRKSRSPGRSLRVSYRIAKLRSSGRGGTAEKFRVEPRRRRSRRWKTSRHIQMRDSFPRTSSLASYMSIRFTTLYSFHTTLKVFSYLFMSLLSRPCQLRLRGSGHSLD